MKKQNLNIILEDELIQKLILRAKKEGITFEDYLIKTLKQSLSSNSE